MLEKYAKPVVVPKDLVLNLIDYLIMVKSHPYIYSTHPRYEYEANCYIKWFRIHMGQDYPEDMDFSMIRGRK